MWKEKKKKIKKKETKRWFSSCISSNILVANIIYDRCIHTCDKYLRVKYESMNKKKHTFHLIHIHVLCNSVHIMSMPFDPFAACIIIYPHTSVLLYMYTLHLHWHSVIKCSTFVIAEDVLAYTTLRSILMDDIRIYITIYYLESIWVYITLTYAIIFLTAQ